MFTPQYWPLSDTKPSLAGVSLELRSELAWRLLERFAIVTGNATREDSQGRSVIDLLSEEEVMRRAFLLADFFVEAATRRGEIRVFTEQDAEVAAKRVGELRKIQTDTEYPRDRWKIPKELPMSAEAIS